MPCPATITLVAVQFGGVWPLEQSLMVDVVNVTPLAPTTSLVNTFLVCAVPVTPVVVSGFAVGGGGGRTVGVYVELAYWFSESWIWYDSAGGVPLKLATGVNVTTPEEFTTYVPTFATVTVVPAATVQLFGVWAGVVVGLHRRILLAEIVAPAAAESLVKMFFVWAVL